MAITVKGHRVLLKRPKREERLIQLTPEMEKELNIKEIANHKRL